MACHCSSHSSLISSSSSSYSSSSSTYLNPNPKPKPSRRPSEFHFRPRVTAQVASDDHENDVSSERPKPNRLDFLTLSATLTVTSASLPRPKPAIAAVKERKRGGGKKPAAKKSEALMSPQELKLWSQGLPMVSDRIPYSELLELRQNGKLKHVIKPPGVDLRQKAEPVLVVLEDSRVLRTMLPSIDSDRKFWENWDELSVDLVCINAYTPPVKRPEPPAPLLGFMAKLPEFMLSFTKPKKESKKAAELRRAREEFTRKKKEDMERMKKESEMVDIAIKNQKMEADRRLRSEARRKQREDSLRQARKGYQDMAAMWANLADNQNVATALGLVFFYIFYRTVVLSYRKQKRDYEDRLKIEKAEQDEQKKMRELERQMEGLEGGDDDDEAEQGKDKDNPYMKMAMQFMKSGARVRRAPNRRIPQYLERGVDVKFEDVAGLGKIRLELEEIVKFFTHGEMYRRRGVKIPG